MNRCAGLIESLADLAGWTVPPSMSLSSTENPPLPSQVRRRPGRLAAASWARKRPSSRRGIIRRQTGQVPEPCRSVPSFATGAIPHRPGPTAPRAPLLHRPDLAESLGLDTVTLAAAPGAQPVPVEGGLGRAAALAAGSRPLHWNGIRHGSSLSLRLPPGCFRAESWRNPEGAVAVFDGHLHDPHPGVVGHQRHDTPRPLHAGQVMKSCGTGLA